MWGIRRSLALAMARANLLGLATTYVAFVAKMTVDGITYDAQRILEAFGARLRNEVDWVRLTDSLCNAVEETLQPASVWVWLRGP
jgi:GTP cyclohydrolase I